MATHSSVLAWRIPGTGEPGGLPFMGSHRVGHDWSDLAAAAGFLKAILLILLGYYKVIICCIFIINVWITIVQKCEFFYILHFWCLVLVIGAGNGNPLQYSCLENPMDGGAWWLQSMGSLRVGHDWATSLSLFTFMNWRRKWQPSPVFLPGESRGRGSLVGCRLWGRTELDTTEAT